MIPNNIKFPKFEKTMSFLSRKHKLLDFLCNKKEEDVFSCVVLPSSLFFLIYLRLPICPFSEV